MGTRFCMYLREYLVNSGGIVVCIYEYRQTAPFSAIFAFTISVLIVVACLEFCGFTLI